MASMQVRENADVADSKSRPVCIESEKVRRARGHADRPLSEAELYEKFRTCLDAGEAKIAPDTLFDRLKHLESLSARELASVG